MASNFIVDDSGNALFDYSLRVSHKARYAKLLIKPYHGLEVVIPTRFPKKAVPELIRQHENWIKWQLGKHQQHFVKPDLPKGIFLAINNSFTSIASSAYTHKNYRESLTYLRQWVRKQAWLSLPPMLETLSERSGLAYQKICIRSQKTRWGSCSSRGTISLNDQLIFVPEVTAQYLMIHELCHTRYMNHSPKFWQLVESLCADYRYHDRVLNQAREGIPAWYQYSLYR